MNSRDPQAGTYDNNGNLRRRLGDISPANSGRRVFRLIPGRFLSRRRGQVNKTIEPHSGYTEFDSEGAPTAEEFEDAPEHPYRTFEENVWQDTAKGDMRELNPGKLARK